MVVTRYCLLAFVVLLLSSFSAKAQQCANCNLTPEIALYDFDLQVQKPDDPNREVTWILLHGLSWHASNHIIKNNGECVRFIESFSTNKNGNKTIIMSNTLKNLPGPGEAAGDYFITGTVSEGDLDFILEVRLHASCSKKVIESSQVRFAKNSDLPAIVDAAKLAAGKFLNIDGLIRQSEIKDRNESAGADISAIHSMPIGIKPSKTTLKAGEKSEIILTIKDCDDKPVAGRELFFNATTFEGMKIPGTIGGTVTPAKVVTDVNGIAKATFTLAGGSAKAIIAAHGPAKDVRGCNSIFFGDVPINIKYTHSGYVTYTYDGSSGLTSDTSDKTMHHFYTGKENTSITYRASFYGEGEAGGISLSNNTDESDGTAVPEIMEFGTYHYSKSDYWKNTMICECAMKGDVTEQKINNTGSGEIKNGSIHFSYNEGGGRLTLNLIFNSSNTYSFKATHMDTNTSSSEGDLDWPVHFDTFLDKNFTIKKEKVGNKIKYTAEGEQTIKVKLLRQTARVKMVLWEE